MSSQSSTCPLRTREQVGTRKLQAVLMVVAIQVKVKPTTRFEKIFEAAEVGIQEMKGS